MKTPVVVLTDPLDHTAVHGLKGVKAIVLPNLQVETYRPLLRQAHVFVVRSGSALPSDILDDTPNLIGVIRHGAGVDVIPMDTATRLGIPVANTPGGNAPSVAEYGVLTMGMLLKRLHIANVHLHSDGWDAARTNVGETGELEGKTVGIIGVGEVGRRLAHMCHAGFGMRVLGYQRRLQRLPSFVEPAALETVFAHSDFVVLSCPLTPETRNIISVAQLASMKPTAFVINLARGELMNTSALLDALNQGVIAGAALDVYAEEPLPPNDPLLRSDKLLLTPHIAARTRESAERNSALTVRQLHQLLKGERPQFLINESAWAASAERRSRIIEMLATP